MQEANIIARQAIALTGLFNFDLKIEVLNDAARIAKTPPRPPPIAPDNRANAIINTTNDKQINVQSNAEFFTK